MPTVVAKTLVAGILAAGLAACASSGNGPPAASTEPATPPADDKCNSSRAANLVGQPWDDSMLPQVEAAVGHDTIRPIRPGQPVTMDFREDRLNIEIGADGKVVRVYCA